MTDQLRKIAEAEASAVWSWADLDDPVVVES